MKKIKLLKLNSILIVSLYVLVLLVFNVTAAQTTYNPSNLYDIAVNIINQEPDPAEPGRYVDVRFKFDNNGTKETKNIEVEILLNYPFSLDPGIDAVKNIGTLQSMQKGDVGAIVKYKLRVDKNAVEGENEIKIRYRVDKGVWITLKEFFVDVQTHDAILAIEDISVDKDTVEPGLNSIVKIKLSNKADSILKDVKVKIGLGSVPFIPLGSTTEKSVYQIDARGNYEFTFDLLANPEAKSGVYKVPLEISYSDDLGKGYVNNGTMGIVIGAKPDLSITLDDSEIYESGKSGEIFIKIVNKGVTDIKFMNMKLMPSNKYRILSNDEVYIGNIDSDDYETADFKLFIEKSKENQIKVPVVLEYKDANNNDFKEAIELTLDLYSASEAKKFGLKKGNGFVGNLVIAVIVVAGLFIYRKWRKHKKKHA